MNAKKLFWLPALALTLILVGCGSPSVQPPPEPSAVIILDPLPGPVVQVHDFHVSSPDRKGLTDANIRFSNVSTERLQFVMFKAAAYSADGQLIPAKKTGRPDAWLRVAGPFEPWASAGNHVWDDIWQNRQTACFEIKGVEVIYMDGANEYYDEQQLGQILDAGLTNRCSSTPIAQR